MYGNPFYLFAKHIPTKMSPLIYHQTSFPMQLGLLGKNRIKQACSDKQKVVFFSHRYVLLQYSIVFIKPTSRLTFGNQPPSI